MMQVYGRMLMVEGAGSEDDQYVYQRVGRLSQLAAPVITASTDQWGVYIYV
jgi:hypothetical protein